MFYPEGHLRVWLYGEPVDMRKSFDGLSALARHGLGQDPLGGALFAFVNRRGTQIRVLYFDRSGWCVWAKRLEAGRFIGNWSREAHRELDCTGLKLLLEGVEVRRRRKRYSVLPGVATRALTGTMPACPARYPAQFRTLPK
jgi:transposase